MRAGWRRLKIGWGSFEGIHKFGSVQRLCRRGLMNNKVAGFLGLIEKVCVYD